MLIYFYNKFKSIFFKKYPLGEFYSCTEINKVTEEVWCSLNVENLKNKEKDFSEYIELKSSYNEVYKE